MPAYLPKVKVSALTKKLKSAASHEDPTPSHTTSMSTALLLSTVTLMQKKTAPCECEQLLRQVKRVEIKPGKQVGGQEMEEREDI